MKKICVILAMAICFGFSGCKKSTPAEPKPAQPAAEQAPSTGSTSSPQASSGQAAQAVITAAVEIDLTSPLEKLNEQAKQMSNEALKATAEKYRAEFFSVRSDLIAKADRLAKIPETDKAGAEALELTKETETLSSRLANLKERLMIYVDALRARGVETKGLMP